MLILESLALLRGGSICIFLPITVCRVCLVEFSEAVLIQDTAGVAQGLYYMHITKFRQKPIIVEAVWATQG